VVDPITRKTMQTDFDRGHVAGYAQRIVDETRESRPIRLIYVVVHVSYDYYRFQENLGAAAAIKDARRIAKEQVSSLKMNLPVIESEDESRKQDNAEGQHIWIEKIRRPPNKEKEKQCPE